MNIFIENICFAQNSVNDLELGLTSAPSMLEFDVACWYFYYAIKVTSFLKSFNATMTCNFYHQRLIMLNFVNKMENALAEHSVSY